MKRSNGYRFSGNPETWTSEDKKRFENFCETIAYMEKVLKNNGFLIRRHTLIFDDGKMTYCIHFGGVEFLGKH